MTSTPATTTSVENNTQRVFKAATEITWDQVWNPLKARLLFAKYEDSIDDEVFWFPSTNVAMNMGDPDVYIAGSYPLSVVQASFHSQLTAFLRRTFEQTHKVKLPYLGLNASQWKSNDVDYFKINCETAQVQQCVADAQFICTKDRSIEELLLRFDLAPCRVAFSGVIEPKSTTPARTYISAQALMAIHTNNIQLPEYVNDQSMLYQRLLDHFLKHQVINSEKHAKTVSQQLFCRYQNRMSKYIHRNFIFRYVDTHELPPYVLGHMEYILNDKVRQGNYPDALQLMECMHEIGSILRL